MANKRANKECLELRICIDNQTDIEIIKFQAHRVAKDGLRYRKDEAASDLFRELLNGRGKR